MPDVPLSSLTPLSMLPNNAEILVSVTGSNGQPTFARLDPLALAKAPGPVPAVISAPTDTPMLLSEKTTLVAVCLAGGLVRLPPQTGLAIINRGANPLTVYPPAGGTIEGQSTQFISPGGSATFVSADLINFYAI